MMRSVTRVPRPRQLKRLFQPFLRLTSRIAEPAIRTLPRAPLCISFAPSRQFASQGVQATQDGETDYLLADIGEGIAEVEVLQWFVKEGDEVEQFDKVAEVQSDKATVEITSRYDGKVIKLYHRVNDMAQVGQPLMRLKLKGGQTPPEASVASAPPSAGRVAPPTSFVSSEAKKPAAGSRRDISASPAVRKLAKENNIDLSLVTATGPKGRILKEDILNHIAGTPSAPPASEARAAPAAAAVTATPISRVSVAPLEDKTIPITGLQRIMVQTMTTANAVPTFGYSDEIVVDELIQIREKVKPIAEKAGVKLTYMAFFIKAASLALHEYPQLNAWVDKDCTNVTIKGAHNISLAMDTPRGLIVPNIKNVQNLSVLEVAQELIRLGELGKNNKLGQNDLSGGTFALSNIGTIGGTVCRPILVVPQVVIGALGKFMTVPRYADNQLRPTNIFTMSWSADHRVVDGATMARFSNLWKQYLENPSTMIINTR